MKSSPYRSGYRVRFWRSHLETSAHPARHSFPHRQPGIGDHDRLRSRLGSQNLPRYGVHRNHRLCRRHSGRQLPSCRPLRLQLHLHHWQPPRRSRRSLRNFIARLLPRNTQKGPHPSPRPRPDLSLFSCRSDLRCLGCSSPRQSLPLDRRTLPYRCRHSLLAPLRSPYLTTLRCTTLASSRSLPKRHQPNPLPPSDLTQRS
jgi:hypothetical protein